MKPVRLDKLLKGIPEGQWVALSHHEERVLATGVTLDEVLKKAKKKAPGERPIVWKVNRHTLILAAA